MSTERTGENQSLSDYLAQRTKAKIGEAIKALNATFAETGNLGNVQTVAQNIVDRIQTSNQLENCVAEKTEELTGNIKYIFQEAGLELPEGSELELIIVLPEQAEESVRVETPDTSTETQPETLQDLIWKLPNDLSVTSIWSSRNIWERNHRCTIFEDLQGKPESEIADLLGLEPQGNDWPLFKKAIKNTADLWQKCQTGEIDEKNLGPWKIIGKEVLIEKGVGKGVTISREDYTRSIQDLSLSPRNYRCLVRARYSSIGGVLSSTEEELRGIEQFGPKSYQELIDTLTGGGYLYHRA